MPLASTMTHQVRTTSTQKAQGTRFAHYAGTISLKITSQVSQQITYSCLTFGMAAELLTCFQISVVELKQFYRNVYTNEFHCLFI
jgi:hypothetical protein